MTNAVDDVITYRLGMVMYIYFLNTLIDSREKTNEINYNQNYTLNYK